jgi:thioredoxin-related protein
MIMMMMRNAILGLAAALLMFSASGAVAAEVEKEGVTAGNWTMDIEAARKQAKEKKTAILLNFTGSDWCGWCKLMDKNVFSQQAWKDYARKDLALVFIDFPKDKSLVPTKYAARNSELKTKFKVKGYPTYVLLDDDGETVLGTLRAGKTKTAKSFIAELRVLTRYRASEVAKYSERLNAKDKAEYQQIVAQMNATREALKKQKQQIADAQKKVAELKKKAAQLKETATEFRAAKLGPEKLKEYKELKTKLKAAQKKLADWLATRPRRSQENARKFGTLNAEVQALSAKLSGF